VPYPIVAFPDATLAVIQYLRSRPEVTDLIDPGNIGPRLPDTPSWPQVMIHRGGGTPVTRQWVDDAAIQVDAMIPADPAQYPDGPKQCADLIAAVVACLSAIADDTVPEAVLCGARIDVGPLWMPDPVSQPPLSRYVARATVTLHPVN